jgi:hypothetical protein
LFFAHNLSSVDADIVETVRRLSKDPVPAVRLKIADHLGTLWKTSPDIVTEIVADMAEHDSSSCVVLSLLNRPMHGLLLWQCPEEVGKWAEIVFGRTDFGGKTARDVRSTCAFIFLELFLWKNHARSETFIHDFTGDILQYTGEATRIVAALREILVSGPIDPPDPIAEAARTRSFMVLEEIATSVPKAFSVLQQTHKGKRFSEWPAQDREMINKMAQLLDCIATQLYFASGAYDEKPSQKSERHVSDEQKKRFLKESEKLFSLLSIEPHPSTVQHVVDTLQSLLDIDPRTVFLRIVNFVKAGKDEGYQYESLAVDLIVRVVNRVFADFRPMLQEHQDTRDAMVAMLDIFVEAGWLPAIQLTYRLDEIFR